MPPYAVSRHEMPTRWATKRGVWAATGTADGLKSWPTNERGWSQLSIRTKNGLSWSGFSILRRVAPVRSSLPHVTDSKTAGNSDGPEFAGRAAHDPGNHLPSRMAETRRHLGAKPKKVTTQAEFISVKKSVMRLTYRCPRSGYYACLFIHII